MAADWSKYVVKNLIITYAAHCIHLQKNNLEEEMSRACSSLLIPFRIFHFHEIFAFDRKVKCKL